MEAFFVVSVSFLFNRALFFPSNESSTNIVSTFESSVLTHRSNYFLIDRPVKFSEQKNCLFNGGKLQPWETKFSIVEKQNLHTVLYYSTTMAFTML